MSVQEQLINDIKSLPEDILLDISAVIKERVKLNTDKKRNYSDIGKKRREMFGCMKGKTWVSEDFDAPLEEFKEYM